MNKFLLFFFFISKIINTFTKNLIIMRNLITFLFFTILSITLTVSMLVGVAWLIDLKPKNLYLVWEICYSSLAVSLLLFILFGGRKNN